MMMVGGRLRMLFELRGRLLRCAWQAGHAAGDSVQRSVA